MPPRPGVEEGESEEVAGRLADEVPEAAAEEPEKSEEATPEQKDDGPVFEVSDRRGSIVADGTGITFRLDEEMAEFRWDEIGAVEIDIPRFGRRFSVTVYTSAQRWFQNDVEAPTKALLKEWETELDTVLDARFDDGASGKDAATSEPDEAGEAGKADTVTGDDRAGEADKKSDQKNENPKKTEGADKDA
ncbi:hypothetical protein ACFVIM_24920 [Streptomyces sp. NPDC057638]|uniref:hypothetical protein n=1 Tax=Streptomyces sp. NPDC057638 TaxID=3346190 RepID=UPI00367BBCB9